MSDTITVAIITATAVLIPSVLSMYFTYRTKKLELLHSTKEKNRELLRKAYLNALSILQAMVNRGYGDSAESESLQKSLLIMLLYAEKPSYKLISKYIFAMIENELTCDQHRRFQTEIINCMRQDLFTTTEFDEDLYLYSLK